MYKIAEARNDAYSTAFIRNGMPDNFSVFLVFLIRNVPKLSDTVQKCCSICCKILKLCLTIFGRYTLKVLMFISYVKQISPGKKVNVEIIKLFQIIQIRLKNLHRLHMANESK